MSALKLNVRYASDNGHSTAELVCPLSPGLGVKLSTIILAGPTVLSAVGACPPHDGVRRRWWINVASAVALSGARKESADLTTATVPAGTVISRCVAGTLWSVMLATR
jgi:hypothetical protein